MDFCDKVVPSRSKYSAADLHRCFRCAGHSGACAEFPYLNHLRQVAPAVAMKIIRDSTMTTGAPWKSEDAGPNRIRRWAMLLSDEDLLILGVHMAKLKPHVRAKLREKAAPYDACMAVAQKLTALVYAMQNAPAAPADTRTDLEQLFGRIEPGTTNCLICLAPLDFRLFAAARRGKAEIETAHSNARLHTPDNVGFAHRACNIAQGDKTLEEFYTWIGDILRRAQLDR